MSLPYALTLEEKIQENLTIKLGYICNLVEFMGWSTPHINPPPCCFSSTWGYQMCQAQFGTGQIQINILFQRATSPCWVSKKNTLGFICIATSALMMLYVLALDSNSHLWLHFDNSRCRLPLIKNTCSICSQQAGAHTQTQTHIVSYMIRTRL